MLKQTVVAFLLAAGYWNGSMAFMPNFPSSCQRFAPSNSISLCRMQGSSYNFRPPPPPPRRSSDPPPPPPRQEAPIKVEREAGEWRQSVLGARTPKPWDGQEKVVRVKKTPDMLREERLRKEKAEASRRNNPPPPMLTEKEWEVRQNAQAMQKRLHRHVPLFGRL
jgi:hypothetical protein